MNIYRRHDLVWLDDKGKEYALHHIQSCIPAIHSDEIRKLLFSEPPVPGIVCRQEPQEPDLLRIGFSFPRIIDGLRLRIGTAVPPDCIIQHKTPFDTARLAEKENLPDRAALEALMEAGTRHHTEIGCFGSAALQLATRLAYRREGSDLDIFLRHQGDRHALSLFFQELLEIEKQFAIVIDAEIEYQGNYGVKLKELFAPGKTILGKGQYDVVLLYKEEGGACFPAAARA